MSYLTRVFTGRFMKTLLMVCSIALLIAAIWFLGPFFGFGDSRPLQRMESRAVFIVLAILYLICFWLRWPLFIALTATLCAIVWVFGPFLLAGQTHPLAPIGFRLAIIGVLLLCALLYGIWLLLIALKDNPALLDKLVRRKAPVTATNSLEISAAIARAVNYVNKRRSNLSFFQRVILARKPLDRLPWYMVLGTQEAGKTSAILGSGQDFPLPEQLDQIGKPAQKTLSCDCWLANDAIYVDTAGKFVSEPEANINEWHTILKTLKKYRPVKAINGVILTFSAADVLGRNPAELFELAASLRGRVEDLRQTLGVRFPVYVLVTKLDQLPGFAEYFRMLTEQEREQVWGVTFPYGDTKEPAASSLQGRIIEELALLESRIDRDMIVRQQEEYGSRDRKKMYALPQDFHLLSKRVAEVVHNTIFASRYDESQNYIQLRGLYFTSSHQPVDFSLQNNQSIMRQWRNYVEGTPVVALASLSERLEEHDFLIGEVSYGRQYFLRQLFTEVIVKDCELAKHNLANESKFRLQRLLGHTFSILLAMILLNGFWHSYHNNRDYLDTMEAKVGDLQKEVDHFVKQPTDDQLPPLLTLTQYLPEYGALPLFHPPLEWRYGFYTSHHVVSTSDSLYQFFLQRLLLPQIEKQATLSLQNAIDEGSPEQIYHQLKIYLLVYGQGKFNKAFAINAIIDLWQNSGKLPPYQEQDIFVAHLNRLFDSPDWRQYGHKLDDGLVKYARALLEREDLASRLYQRIKDSVAQDIPAELTPAMMAKARGSELLSLANPDGMAAIPGLFTRTGYYEVFKKKMDAGVLLMQQEDAWVLGKSGAQASPLKLMQSGARVNTVQQQILTRYFNDYAHHWQEFLGNIRLRRDVMRMDQGRAGISGEIYMLRMLSASDSPLANFLLRAVSETTLAAKEDKSLADAANHQGKIRILSAAAKVNLAYAATEKKLIKERVDNLFAPLREFVTGAQAPAGDAVVMKSGTKLSKLMDALSEQYMLFVVYDDSLKNGNAVALSSSVQQLGVEAQTWPTPLPQLISPLLERAWRNAVQEAVVASNDGIEGNLGLVCRATLQGRYPFASSQREVKLADFERFFATDGLVDSYFKKHLADKVNISSRPWRYKGDLEDREDVLPMFEKAAEIRQAFFQEASNRRLSLTFNISVPYLDPRITQLNMTFDGEPVNYAHWPVSPASITWPSSRAASKVTIGAVPRVVSGNSSRMFTSPWALFRWLDSASDMQVTDNDDTQWVFLLDGRKANIAISGLSYKNRSLVDMLKNFRCPGEY